MNTEIKQIRIFSRDEKKQEDMRIKFSNSKLRFYIGDVRDTSSLEMPMQGVDYVFHAAALKQVPSCEFYPMEAFKTNVIGTENVLNVAVKCNVKKVIVLSTDKAVYPINAMGISKAMMEKVCVAKSRFLDPTQTIISCTRYGNVMASRGSVIPLFVEQLKNGKDLTVTDSEMTRFLMSLDDAVNLVLYAFQNGAQGDIFVQKSPACTIAVLANALLRLFNSNSKIKIIGTRHGEKLYESLLTREEMNKAIDLGEYYRIPADNRNLNYNKYFVEGEELGPKTLDYHSHNTTRLDVDQVLEKLKSLDYIRNQLND